jgi:hypothetical protein
LYLTTVPGFPKLATSAESTISMLGVAGISTVAVDGAESIGAALGGVPVATARSLIAPASTSACVTTYSGAVHVVEAPGASVVTGQLIGPDRPLDGAENVSVTPTTARGFVNPIARAMIGCSNTESTPGPKQTTPHRRAADIPLTSR